MPKALLLDFSLELNACPVSSFFNMTSNCLEYPSMTSSNLSEMSSYLLKTIDKVTPSNPSLYSS